MPEQKAGHCFWRLLFLINAHMERKCFCKIVKSIFATCAHELYILQILL